MHELMQRTGGPWFEDLHVGQVFDDAPPLTITSAHAAVHQAICGDRLRLALDAELCRAVTGRPEPLANPMLVCNIAIGQTTGASQRVRANLFYRGLVLQRPVHVGDTLTTRAEVAGLKQNRRGGAGLVALHMTTSNQRGETVLECWRCPMIPMRDPDVQTGHADTFDAIPAGLDLDRVRSAVPDGWHLDLLPRDAKLRAGDTFEVEGGDTVTSAPELARLTLNIAALHHDPAVTADGRRLVYGGHTIAIGFAQTVRMLPGIATVLAWRSCDHTGPVHEGDVLRTRLTVEDVHPGGLVELRADVSNAEGSPVLDWRFVALVP